MRSFLMLALVLATMQTAAAETYTSSPTVLRKKTIYARAEGKVTKLNFEPGQVFLWDEFAANITPSISPRAEYGRAYSDFAGAVSKVLVEEGQYLKEGDPIYECRFLERVYATCEVPADRLAGNDLVDKPIKATWRGETFDAKVVDTATQGDKTVLYIVIYNNHDHHYWHLTQGESVSIEL